MSIPIGIIGYGTIGSFLHDQIASHPEWGMHISLICNRPGPRMEALPPEIVVHDPMLIDPGHAALIVEAAHPVITRAHAEHFLRSGASYMPLSLTALADEGLLEKLHAVAEEHGSTLYVPHGAAVGIDSLAECRDTWETVSVIMKKNPANLDFSDSGEWRNSAIDEETVLYDGPTRALCAQFPRNVNAHAAVALAGIGFDRTRSVLIADPGLKVSVIEIEAYGAGVHMKIQRSNPLKGVSGLFTLRSALAAVVKAKGKPQDPVVFC